MSEDPIGRLLDTAGARLAAYGYLLTGSRAAADALLHDAIVKVFVRRRRVGGGAESAVRDAMRALHLAAVHRQSEPPPQDEPLPPGEVGRALNALPLDQRAVVVLRYHDHLQIPDIAGAMRLGEDAVGRMLSDAKTTLTRLLGDIEPVMDPIEVVSRRAG